MGERKNGSFVVEPESGSKKRGNQMYKCIKTATNNLPTKSGSNSTMDETIAGKHMMPSFK